MSRVIDGAAPEVQDELDRIWSALDKTNAYVEQMAERWLKERRLPVGSAVHRDLGLPFTHDVQGRRLQAAPSPDYSLDKTFGAVPDMPAEDNDECGCPASDDLRSKLRAIEAIVSEMLPPSGMPSPAQKLLLRVREELGLSQ